MLFITIALFVLRVVFTKLMFLYQVATNQKLQRVIHGGAADVEFFLFKEIEQRLGFKVVIAFVNFFEYGVALGSFAQFFPFKVSRKNILYLFNMFIAVYSHARK